MKKFCWKPCQNIIVFIVAFSILCTLLSGCEASDYIKITNNTMTVDYKNATGNKPLTAEKKDKICSNIIKKWQNSESPLNELVIIGEFGSNLMQGLTPIAHSIEKLVLDYGINCSRVDQSAYTNLKTLQICKLSMDETDNPEVIIEALRNFPQLRELQILSPQGNYFKFSQKLKESGLSLTVNGQALNVWNPLNDLEDNLRARETPI